MFDFDLDRLRAELPDCGLEYHQVIDSTNTRALELARGGAGERPLLVLARSQTAGRGRGENRWWGADGGLMFSLLLPLVAELPPADRPRFSLAAGLAVSETLDALVPGRLVGLKWPNDVFLNGRKVCGILIESVTAPRAALVIGVGLNVNNSFGDAPAELRGLATSLFDETGRPHSLTDVLVQIVRRIEFRGRSLTLAPQAIADDWGRYCLLTDRVVQLNSGGRRVMGRCRGIAADGALILQTESGEERLRSGTVVSWS